jgi:hypothetical protein
MTGIQYDDLNAEEGKVTGTTYWFAYRTFFYNSRPILGHKKCGRPHGRPHFFDS